METPIKSTRRKLKKIMKKSRANLSVSTNNIYQKKLKSAINVSLNSTRTVRTLQSNNRSLATSLEKMRQDFRQVHDHYALLLEENHELREKILELQRINVSDMYIEQEVDKRVEERMEHMKRKLVSLSDIATKFMDTLAEVSDICVSSRSSMLEDLSSTESANQNYSLLPNLPLIASDVSLDNISDFESAQSDHNTHAEMEYGDFEKNVVYRRHPAHEMSAIMEQSVLCPPTDFSTVSSKLDGGSSLATSYLEKKLTTKLPIRIAKYINQGEPQNNEQGSKAVRELNKRKSVESPKRVTRRQTFVVPNGLTDDSLLTDIATPPFLVTDGPSENGDFDINVQGEMRTPANPTMGELVNEKSLQKGNTSLKKNSLRHSQVLTPRGKEQSPNKSSPLQQQIPSPKGTKQSTQQRGTRSKKRHVSPKGSPVSLKNKQTTKKMGTADQKSTTLPKKRKSPSPTKRVSPKPEEKQKHNFFISNEFKLINVHKGKEEKASRVNISSVIQHESPSEEKGEHTIFPIDDMEFTRMDESIMAPASIYQSSGDSDNTKCTEFVPHLPATHSRSRSKQSELSAGDVEGLAEEKIPDAVTMRCTKPGQMMFAAARKETDGTRKNVPVVSRVRSKSKKKMAEMIESMADTQPETIFDFHDKTPVFLNNEKQKTNSVFNFSADQSKLSPLTPLNKNRSRSRKSKSLSNDVSSKNTSQSHNLDIGQNDLNKCIMIEVSVPLKGDSPPSNLTYRTRSQSVGRQQHVNENSNMEVKPPSPSRSRRAKSKAQSPGNGKKTSSEVLSTNGSSPATKDWCSKSKSVTELTSDDTKNDKPVAASHSTSDAVCEQKEEFGNLQVDKIEIKGNKISKNRSRKVSKKQVYDKTEQKNETETHKDITSESASTSPEELTVSSRQQVTVIECTNIALSAESDIGNSFDTSTKTASDSQKEMQDKEAVVSKKKTLKVTSHKTREKSLPKSTAKIDFSDSDSEFSGPTHFINTRRERTKGMKENKDLEEKSDEKKEKSTIDDLAATGFY